jgi:hypothetical protein
MTNKDGSGKKVDEKLKEALKIGDAKPEHVTKIKFSTATEDLSEEELSALDAEIEAEIVKELKLAKIKEYKESKKQEAKKQKLFKHGKDEAGDDTEVVLLTLAPHMPFIRLDGATYYPGRAYRLSRGKAAVLKEQMYRGDLHDNEIAGKNMKAFYGHRPENRTINPNSL